MFNVDLLGILIHSVVVPCTLTKPCNGLWFDSKFGGYLSKAMQVPPIAPAVDSFSFEGESDPQTPSHYYNTSHVWSSQGSSLYLKSYPFQAFQEMEDETFYSLDESLWLKHCGLHN
ncbi:hypothetical protein VNO77_23274 [Canavalia gladiata]|uniref:Uncharacterized protein n=1 Tax=Canavalia gladiata TaxID=3824 RepID=A0AAN9L7H7_CANGL